MKTREIRVGKTYTDNKDNVRRVVDQGPHCVLFPAQSDTDCVRYLIVKKKRGPNKVGDLYNTTRNSFARWAKQEASDEQGV